MASGGLKSAEKKMDEKLLNKHHSVRVTDFAMEVLKNYDFRRGKLTLNLWGL